MPIIIDNDVGGLANWVRSAKSHIIFLDGYCQAGKTWLARRLLDFNFATIDADKFITHKTGGYFNYLNFSDFMAEISEIQSKPIIISGVRARDVADRLQINSAKFVYVVRYRDSGLEGEPLALAIERDEKVCSNLMQSATPLEKEVIEYHKRVKPRTNADVIFHNRKPSEAGFTPSTQSPAMPPRRRWRE